jgi:hypothetical protein
MRKPVKHNGITVKVTRAMRAAIMAASPREGLTLKAMATPLAALRATPSHVVAEGVGFPRLAWKPEGASLPPKLGITLGQVTLKREALGAVRAFLEAYDWLGLTLYPTGKGWRAEFRAYGIPHYHAVIVENGEVEEVEA